MSCLFPSCLYVIQFLFCQLCKTFLYVGGRIEQVEIRIEQDCQLCFSICISSSIGMISSLLISRLAKGVGQDFIKVLGQVSSQCKFSFLISQTTLQIDSLDLRLLHKIEFQFNISFLHSTIIQHNTLSTSRLSIQNSSQAAF